MTPPLSLTDRLRIERAVWTLDTYLADLPRTSRVARRREVRADLRAAARDVGTAEALRRLGNLRRLAVGFLAAEYGDWRPRPSWYAGTAGLLLAIVVMTALVETGQSTFGDAVRAAHPDASGTFHWHGLPYLTGDTTYTFTNGTYTAAGGAWTPLVYVLLAAVFVLGGRIWRQLPAWRRRHTDD
jgi:hypothetical protein